MRTIDPSQTRVAVLAGGTSSEREISLSSGRQVYEALTGVGFPCDLYDPRDIKQTVAALESGDYDIAFIVMHGRGGEDGTIQGLCELVGLPYTGSGVRASAIAMDKSLAKILYASAGIPIAPSMTLHRGQAIDHDALIETVGQKCVVKPSRDGSSVGMSIVHEPGELPAAIEVAFAVADEIIVERFVQGTEITVAVLGNDDPEPLPVIEIVPHAEFYDFEVKYSPTGADHIIPARLANEVYVEAQRLAVAAHKVLGCRGMSRSDFIVTDDGTCVILETNTIPGMTPTSLLPDTARHAGYDFGALCTRIIELALVGV